MRFFAGCNILANVIFSITHYLNPPEFKLTLEYFHMCIAEPESDTAKLSRA